MSQIGITSWHIHPTLVTPSTQATRRLPHLRRREHPIRAGQQGVRRLLTQLIGAWNCITLTHITPPYQPTAALP